MPDLITEKALVNSAVVLRDAFQSNVHINTYMVAANHLPFEDDDDPDAPDNSEFFQTYDMARKIIFGKRLTPSDISLAIDYYPWVSGTVYSAYDDKDPLLHTKKFYTITKEGSYYSVFKCIYNNKGAPSTYMPKRSETNIVDEFYKTNDDYVWKILYTVSTSDFNKFSVANKLFPCSNNPAAQNAAVDGAISSIVMERGGSGYTTYISGSFRSINISGNNLVHAVQSDSALSANTDFYKYCGLYIKAGTGMGQLRQIEEYVVTGSDRRIVIKSPFSPAPDYSSKFDIAPFVEITGDGSGAEAIVSINSVGNTVHAVSMVRTGNNYTDATVRIVANPAVLPANNAICRAIISPQGGHGSDIQTELFAKSVVFSTRFEGSEGGAISILNDYRTSALLMNPVFANTVCTVDSVSGFSVGQRVVQTSGLDAVVTGVNIDGVGTIRIGKIQGMVDTAKPMYAVNSSNTITASTNVASTDRNLSFIDNRSAYQVEPVSPLSQFIQDEKIIQDSTNKAYGYLHSIVSGTMYLTGVVGTFSISDFTVGAERYLVGERSGAVAKVNGYNPPDILKHRGKLLYINTRTPIERSESQSERLKLVIEF